MAEAPALKLKFEGKCTDCGVREVQFPPSLPDVGDDFDWLVRDFESFRKFMLEELAARFPERKRWTPADIEVVIVEVLAAALDHVSDMVDRVASEGFLETARSPSSVRKLLEFIGYDAAQALGLTGDVSKAAEEMVNEQLERLWSQNPDLMENARREGPRAIHEQKRMVTVDDYKEQLEDHPLVLRAHGWSEWSGSWSTVRTAIICWGKDKKLDNELDVEDIPENIQNEVDAYHATHGIPKPKWDKEDPPTYRAILYSYIERYRMSGQEVVLQDAIPIGIQMSISVKIDENFFKTEVRNAIGQALGTGPGGFFESGRLKFGEDLYASDIYQTLMALDGVENVCLNLFKRIGNQYPDQVDYGQIELNDLEIAVCDNDLTKPDRGYYYLTLHGGRKG